MSNITENSELGRRQKNETKAKCILEGSTRITTFKFCFYFNYENNSIFGWLSVSPWDLTKIPNFRITFVLALTQKVAKWTSSFRFYIYETFSFPNVLKIFASKPFALFIASKSLWAQPDCLFFCIILIFWIWLIRILVSWMWIQWIADMQERIIRRRDAEPKIYLFDLVVLALRIGKRNFTSSDSDSKKSGDFSLKITFLLSRWVVCCKVFSF